MKVLKTRAWTRRQALWFITGATGSLVLHGFTHKADATQSSTKPVSTASENIIGNGYTPLHIALENGYLKEGNLNLIYRESSSYTKANSAFKAGHHERESLLASEVVLLGAKRESHQILMASDHFFGGDGIVLSHPVSLAAKGLGLISPLAKAQRILNGCRYAVYNTASLRLRYVFFSELKTP